jgi:hypothetical protein
VSRNLSDHHSDHAALETGVALACQGQCSDCGLSYPGLATSRQQLKREPVTVSPGPGSQGSGGCRARAPGRWRPGHWQQPRSPAGGRCSGSESVSRAEANLCAALAGGLLSGAAAAAVPGPGAESQPESARLGRCPRRAAGAVRRGRGRPRQTVDSDRAGLQVTGVWNLSKSPH